MTRVDAESLVPEIERAFRATREVVLEAFRRPEERPSRKEDGTVVTELDHELEGRLSRALLDLDARWGLFGEEGGVLREGSPTWHLDALDGTLNFSRRLPLFVSQAALLDEGEPVLAVIYDPLRDLFAWAAAGAGAWREGERLEVARRPIRDALLLVDIARRGALVQRPELLPRLRRSVFRMRSLGCAGIHLLSVAAGHADAFLGTRESPSPLHDVAPGTLFVREAGGRVTSFDGGSALEDRRSLLAANPDLHAALRELLGPERVPPEGPQR